ncbi:AAA family ATPase [Haladaptatus sp. AB618]|uniref:AAA family ATPase n=1 Tax=Haladaptatus sp. AB618 TaxID=2934173 RepID=UPI00209C0F9C|nr:AAA family ATPase [Haladaptatus sp. AB618]
MTQLAPGDIILARRTGGTTKGVKGIWEYQDRAEISNKPNMTPWGDTEYQWILYCDAIQRELENPFEEDWEKITDLLGLSSVNKATGKIQGAVTRVDKDLASYYLENLIQYEGIDEKARNRLEDILEEQDLSSQRSASIQPPNNQTDGGERGKIKQLLDDESTTTTAPYYWVNQSNNPEEIEEGYLRASRTDFPNYDLQKLNEGDIVFNYTEGMIIGYSEVTRPAYLVEAENEEKRRVDVEVTRFDDPIQFVDVYPYLWREDVRLDKYYPVNRAGVNQQYLFNLSKKAGDYLLKKGTQNEINKTNVNRLQQRTELPQISVSLPNTLYFQEKERSRIRYQINAALNAGKHIIFTGPPGTGKSRIAKEVARVADNEDSVDGYTFTTATAEWSSFDTIGGYSPSNSDGELEFDPRLFLQCFRDEDDTVRNRWLIIDELNRANIDKALGPLFSVLSQDSVDLPFERDSRVRIDWVESDADDLPTIARDRDRFPVTPAWRMIGTMNTFDKTSLYDLSFAFMRRFSFIHVGVPILEGADGIVSNEFLDPDEARNYATVWQKQRPHLQETIDDYHEELALIWSIINEYRSLGPAIILDMIEQLAVFEGDSREAALSSTMINLVFPQLEGMRQDDQKSLLEDLEEGGQVQTGSSTETVDLSLDLPYLRQKARDLYGLDIDVYDGD